jgi:hypothetical protein
MTAKNFIPNTTMKEVPSLLQKILEQYETLKGGKILESLRNFTFDHENSNFAEACLKGVKKYFEEKGGKVEYEELLAVLVRANIMNFVERGHIQNLWYLLLYALLPKELHNVPKSVLVEKMETEFIKFMEVLKLIYGENAVKDGVLKFLLKENREFTLSVLYTIDSLLGVEKTLLGIEKEKILN